MERFELLRKLEGMHTAETAAEALSLGRQSALNLLSKLKKEGYVKTKGGGKQKRLYRVSAKKQRTRNRGMFDVINKYSPMKLAPWYDHQVHGNYGPEEALIDALETQSFRVILASMKLFNHITDWPKLYRLSREKGCWQKVGALYDVARLYFKVRKMPARYRQHKFLREKFLIKKYPTEEPVFYAIEKMWNVSIPFKEGDIRKAAS
ncbi:hypothetical protein J4470_03680 [Candidatus Woesearchaeota archaeon]|nr:hypothetical protein [Candidatus Woesearchaeota archaeon]